MSKRTWLAPCISGGYAWKHGSSVPIIDWFARLSKMHLSQAIRQVGLPQQLARLSVCGSQGRGGAKYWTNTRTKKGPTHFKTMSRPQNTEAQDVDRVPSLVLSPATDDSDHRHPRFSARARFCFRALRPPKLFPLAGRILSGQIDHALRGRTLSKEVDLGERRVVGGTLVDVVGAATFVRLKIAP